ncbi:MAG: hypothetical protein HYX60_03285 [Legionella longbeachae]|nr:hypothetical protein [Legionella longbeachae]
MSIHQIAVGSNHIIISGFTKNNQQILASSGDNSSGQLGLGDNDDRYQCTIVDIPFSELSVNEENKKLTF